MKKTKKKKVEKIPHVIIIPPLKFVSDFARNTKSMPDLGWAYNNPENMSKMEKLVKQVQEKTGIKLEIQVKKDPNFDLEILVFSKKVST